MNNRSFIKTLLARWATWLFAGVTAWFLVGCATMTKMPLQDKNMKPLDLTQKSVLIAKVKIKNNNKTNQQPTICCVFIKQDVGGKAKQFSFTSPALIQESSEIGKEYFVSMALAPGKANINMIRFLRMVPLLLAATADLPFQREIDVPAGKVLYLGTIDATIEKRENDTQPRAGIVIPLIDQAVAGFSDGTFTATIKDQYDADIAQIRQRFPALKDLQIEKMILPPWEYPKSAIKEGDADDSKSKKKKK
jgi:hypothetical protein